MVFIHLGNADKIKSFKNRSYLEYLEPICGELKRATRQSAPKRVKTSHLMTQLERACSMITTPRRHTNPHSEAFKEQR